MNGEQSASKAGELPPAEELAALLRAARAYRDLSLKEVGRKFGTSHQLIHRIERGRPLKKNELRELARIYRLPLEFFYLDFTMAAQYLQRDVSDLDRQVEELVARLSDIGGGQVLDRLRVALGSER